MSFYHKEQPIFYNDIDDSIENQIQFLKLKLIETHNKLLKQLENNKILQAKLYRAEKKAEQVSRENQTISKKINSIMIRAEKNKQQHEKVKDLQINLNEAQRRNQVLSQHLDNIRKKLQILVQEKNQYQQQCRGKETIINTLRQQNQQLLVKLTNLQTILTEINEKKQSLKKKNDQVLNQNSAIGQQLHQMKRSQLQLAKRVQQYNYHLKLQKDKNLRIENELRLCTNELKDYKLKYQKSEQACERLKDQVYWLQSKCRNDAKGTNEQLQKLTAQFNLVSMLLKERQKELELSKRKPKEEAIKKRQNWEHVKQLVMRLQDEQKLYMSRNPENYSYSYRSQKQDYLNVISQVNDLESTLLTLNVDRKKLINERQKIDNTKIKAKDMITRRKKIEDEISYIDLQIDTVKSKMKKFKII